MNRWGMILGMVATLLIAVENKGIIGQFIKGARTRKKDLEVNWKVLEEAEKKL